MAEACGEPFGNAVKLFGFIEKHFGLLERTSDKLWKVSDLGRRVAKGEKPAIKEALEKNSIYRDLSSNFWTRDVMVGAVETYVRGHYKQGENAKLIAEKFIEAKEYINGLTGKIEIDNTQDLRDSVNFENVPLVAFKIMQLKYALSPPKEPEIEAIVENVAEELKSTNDNALKNLGNSLTENKSNKDVLKALTDTTWAILKTKHNLTDVESKNRAKKEQKQDKN
jgi:hypothetical protein